VLSGEWERTPKGGLNGEKKEAKQGKSNRSTAALIVSEGNTEKETADRKKKRPK